MILVTSSPFFGMRCAMSGVKTFRLGGAGGYSIRAIGHAPTRRDQSPVYERVQLFSDVLGEKVFEIELTDRNVAEACAAIVSAASLCADDANFLVTLCENALQHRAMQGALK